MDFTALELARIQFAFVVSAHIIFPAFTIGLASYLAVLEALHMRTGREVYARIFEFWKHIFAVVFGMGVVSGIVMSYQFGTNWAVFSDRAGPIIGPLMGYEVLSAFFLEAGFLGILLFGRKRVSPRIYMGATLMVAIGTFASAFWILSVNSWMQTPQGYSINEVGQFVPEDWIKIVFNPSFPYRLTHMLLAAYLTTALVVSATAAWQLLRGIRDEAGRVMLRMAVGMLIVVAPLQILAGDFHGLNTLEHQPAKIAAMEGHWETKAGAGLILFGLPDDEAEETRFKIEIPYASALILTHSLDGEVPGLGDFPANERPPMEIVFWSFRVMVGLGFAMLGLGAWGGYLIWRKRLDSTRSFHWAALAMGPAGFAAVLAGWITTEVGRQPWTIYGLMRTDESASVLDAATVSASLTAFVVVYFCLFGAGTVYVLRLMHRGPAQPIPLENTPSHAAGRAAPVQDVTTDSKEAHE